ncbi:hypothetical protein LEP1GSC017_0908 [Leptospira meyeri serovar Hardjo str. Went 5]|nr:hypothetical protein LEP1GSC017_0908 [Leptospira meyeri serovar Hardjo str. Went 5]
MFKKEIRTKIKKDKRRNLFYFSSGKKKGSSHAKTTQPLSCLEQNGKTIG